MKCFVCGKWFRKKVGLAIHRGKTFCGKINKGDILSCEIAIQIPQKLMTKKMRQALKAKED